jgi:uncharacterized membrane protein
MSMPSEHPVSSGNGYGANRVRLGNGHRAPGGPSVETAHRLARALGWFSVGLGLATLLAPRRMAQFIGVGPNGGNHALLRAIGARELASGVGILNQRDPSNWLWTRIGGDALDLALLTRAMGDEDADRGRVAATTAAVIGVTAVDAFTTRQIIQDAADSSRETVQAPAHEARIASAITVNAPLDEVFSAWTGFTNLPRFMESFATVRVTDDQLSHWQSSLPGGLTISWDVVISDVATNERIAWRTGDTSRLHGSGEVRFRPAPGKRGTELLFEAQFDPPGGELGNRIAGIFTDALGVKLNNDLRRFKQLTELGEIVKSDDSAVRGPNPAQPVGEEAAR